MGDKVKVYFFKVWDGTTDSFHMPERKSTAERIARVGGAILPETEEEVDVDQLDDEDWYDPRQGDAEDDATAQVSEKPPTSYAT